MRNILIILFFSVQVTAYSQTIISGKIVDKMNKSLSDVSITLINVKDSSIIAYSNTDDGGNYKIQTNRIDSEFLISINSLSIKRQTKQIKNYSQIFNFISEESRSIELREVVVNSTKMWGTKDTVNYSVSAFKDQKDQVIGDVLKKMPGISVAESGAISYKGKLINKFYIENMDMLGGRYGIATNNISASDVATVQVLENHQPIKALEVTKPSDYAAINLKIKPDRKGIFTATAVAGGGYDKNPLWHEELTGMYFGRGFQNISTYKTDNTGTNISKELSSFYGDGGIGTMQMTGMSVPSGPSIRLERYFFNNSHAATINNLKRLKNDANLNYNLTFYSDNEYRHSYSQTKYLLPYGNDAIEVDEDISTQMRKKHLEGEFKYNLNKPNKYLNNSLIISGDWENDTGLVSDSSILNQRYQNLFLNVKNNTHWIKTYSEGKGFEFFSTNSFMRQPHSLTINPGLYPSLFSDDKSYTSLSQDVLVSGFTSNNHLSFLSAWMIKNVRISPELNLDLENRLLQSHVRLQRSNDITETLNDSSFRNDIHWLRFKSSAGFNVSYQSNDIKLSFGLPLSFQHVRVINAFSTEPYTRSKFYFQPSGNFTYSFANNCELNTAYGFNSNSSGLSSLYTGYILSDYRTLNRYDTRMFDTFSNGGSVNFSYKDILSMLFLGAGATYNHYYSEATYGQTMKGILIITQLNEIPNSGNSFSINGRFSKSFDWNKMLISATAMAGKNSGQQFRQNVSLDYQSRWISADASINMKIAQWLSVEYKAMGGCNQNSVSTSDKLPIIQSFNQKAVADIYISDAISFNAVYEYYYNSALQGDKSFALIDAGIIYSVNGMRFSLDWTNILNTSKFISASNAGLNSYYSEYYIRPAAMMLKVKFRLK